MLGDSASALLLDPKERAAYVLCRVSIRRYLPEYHTSPFPIRGFDMVHEYTAFGRDSLSCKRKQSDAFDLLGVARAQAGLSLSISYSEQAGVLATDPTLSLFGYLSSDSYVGDVFDGPRNRTLIQYRYQLENTSLHDDGFDGFSRSSFTTVYWDPVQQWPVRIETVSLSNHTIGSEHFIVTFSPCRWPP
jgi:hypothetical protein